MTLASIADEVCDIVGVERVTGISGATDTRYAQIRALIQQATDDLYRRHDWQALVRLRSYQTVAGEAQPAFLPEDYGRMAAGQTMRTNVNYEEIMGPLSPEQWADVHWNPGGLVAQYWRFIGREIHLYPAPPVGQNVTLEYLSRFTIQSADGVLKDRWSSDTDVSLLPENLIALSAIWRWKSAKGFAYAEDMANFERELERQSGAEAASSALIVSSLRKPFPGPYTSSNAPSGPFISSSSLRSSAI